MLQGARRQDRRRKETHRDTHVCGVCAHASAMDPGTGSISGCIFLRALPWLQSHLLVIQACGTLPLLHAVAGFCAVTVPRAVTSSPLGVFFLR